MSQTSPPVAQSLLSRLMEKVEQDQLVLPTLPEVALQIRDLADRPDSTLLDLTQLVSHDPGLSARLIKVANSALYRRAIPVDSLAAAMSRIGLDRVREIATTLAIEQLFQTKHDLIDRYMRGTWQRSIEVASAASALVSIYLEDVNPHAPFSVEKTGMVGLLYNIGRLPILVELEQMGEEYIHTDGLRDTMIRLQSKVGLEVLRAWKFDREYQEAAVHLNFPLEMGDPLRTVHFIQGALLFSLIEANKTLTPKQLERKQMLQELRVMPEDDTMLSLDFAARIAEIRDTFQ